MTITPEMRQAAKSVDLFQYMIKNHPNDFTIEQGCIRPTFNHSISIKPGTNYYHDFAEWVRGVKGSGTYDNIHFLMKYYDLSYPAAVTALIENADSAVKNTPQPREPKKFRLPDENIISSSGAIKYLYEKRKIPVETIWNLLYHHLIYEGIHHNIIFVSKRQDWWESVSIEDGAKRNCSGAEPGKFWYFTTGDYDTAYICEGAIDAVSLYEIRNHAPGVYVSMHGIGNYQIIDRIIKDGRYKVALAVDNDEAGQNLRQQYPTLQHMIPPDPYKDWNEQWASTQKSKT